MRWFTMVGVGLAGCLGIGLVSEPLLDGFSDDIASAVRLVLGGLLGIVFSLWFFDDWF